MPRSNFYVPQDGSAYVFPDARPGLPAEALAKAGRRAPATPNRFLSYRSCAADRWCWRACPRKPWRRRGVAPQLHQADSSGIDRVPPVGRFGQA